MLAVAKERQGGHRDRSGVNQEDSNRNSRQSISKDQMMEGLLGDCSLTFTVSGLGSYWNILRIGMTWYGSLKNDFCCFVENRFMGWGKQEWEEKDELEIYCDSPGER